MNAAQSFLILKFDSKFTLVPSFFSGWCAFNAIATEFEALEVDQLAPLLKKFYAEVRKQDGTQYAKPTYVGIRAAIHRHLTSEPFCKTYNIMSDREFVAANNVFLGVIRKMKKEGLDRSTHKAIIKTCDLRKLYESKTLSLESPESLQRLVWFNLTYFFCRRGQEGQRNLKKSAFTFKIDDLGKQYVTMNFNENSKNHQGSAGSDFEAEKRMYGSSDTSKCPVHALQMYLDKLNPSCDALFQRPKHNVTDSDSIWYDNVALGKNRLSRMMRDISELSKCSEIYTNHSVRATAITALSASNFDTRTIATLSGHRNQESIRSYCRDSTSMQKQEMFSALQNAVSSPVKPTPSTSSSNTTSVTSIDVNNTANNNTTTQVLDVRHSHDGNTLVLDPVDQAGKLTTIFSACQFSGTINVNFSR